MAHNANAMLSAANDARWDDLIILEVERQGVLSTLMEMDRDTMRPTDHEVYSELIHAILECDEQTKALVRAWQDELSGMLGSVGNERKLADAYRSV